MPPKPALRVFISYTAKDLASHADAVAAVVRRYEWVAIDHKFWAANGRPSVAECRRYVESCQILVVLVAHRYGWVPTVAEGGDGKRSITQIEYEHGVKHGLEIVPMLVDEQAVWSPTLIEALSNPGALGPLTEFKRVLGQGLSGYFSTPQSVEALLPFPLQHAGERLLAAGRAPSTGEPAGTDDDDLIVPYYSDPAYPPTRDERVIAQLPKRILALESADERSGIVIGFLERIERLLQVRYGSPDVRLCDYFDLIGGGGPAAIIAAELAMGSTVGDAESIMRQGLAAMFGSRSGLFAAPMRGAMYKDHALRHLLLQHYGDATVTDPRLRTGMCISTTRFDDGAPMTFTNHPAQRDDPASLAPLRDLILASSASPAFLPPAAVKLGGEEPVLLMSGDVSAGPDPALQLFMLATNRDGAFQWRTGKRRLFLLSLGAGRWRSEAPAKSANLLRLIPMILNSMADGLAQQSHLTLDTLTYDADSESRADARNPNAEPVLSYRRFDVTAEPAWLREHGLAELAAQVESLRRPRDVTSFDTYLRLGQAAGERLIQDPFLPYFDVRKPAVL